MAESTLRAAATFQHDRANKHLYDKAKEQLDELMKKKAEGTTKRARSDPAPDDRAPPRAQADRAPPRAQADRAPPRAQADRALSLAPVDRATVDRVPTRFEFKDQAEREDAEFHELTRRILRGAKLPRELPVEEEDEDMQMAIELSKAEARAAAAEQRAQAGRARGAQAGRAKGEARRVGMSGLAALAALDMGGRPVALSRVQWDDTVESPEALVEALAIRLKDRNKDQANIDTFFKTGQDDGRTPIHQSLMRSGFFQKAYDGPHRSELGVEYPFLPDQTRPYPYLKFLLGEPAAGHEERGFVISKATVDLFCDQSRHGDWAFCFPTHEKSKACPSAYTVTPEEVRLIHSTPDALDSMYGLVKIAMEYFGFSHTWKLNPARAKLVLYTNDQGGCSHECRRMTRLLGFCRTVGFLRECSVIKNELFRLAETKQIVVPDMTLVHWMSVATNIRPMV